MVLYGVIVRGSDGLVVLSASCVVILDSDLQQLLIVDWMLLAQSENVKFAFHLLA